MGGVVRETSWRKSMGGKQALRTTLPCSGCGQPQVSDAEDHTAPASVWSWQASLCLSRVIYVEHPVDVHHCKGNWSLASPLVKRVHYITIYPLDTEVCSYRAERHLSARLLGAGLGPTGTRLLLCTFAYLPGQAALPPTHTLPKSEICPDQPLRLKNVTGLHYA